MFKTRLTTSTIPSLVIALLPYIICGGLAPIVIDYDVRPLIPYLAAYTDMQMLYGVSVILSIMGFGLALYGFDRIRNSYDTTTKIVQAVAIASVLGFLAFYAYESYPHYKNTPFAWSKAYFYFMGEITFIFILPVVVTGVIVVGEVVYRLQNLKPVEQNPFGNASLLSSAEAEHKSNPEGLPLGRILKGLQGNETDLADCIAKSRSGSIFRYNPIHSFLFAPTGAGKGVGFVIPTLLDYDGPVVCIDPKSAENFKITAKHRQAMKGKGKSHKNNSPKRTTYVFDTNDLVDQKSDCFNVFDFLDVESPNIVERTRILSSSLCPCIGDERHDFFIKSAQNILACLLVYVCTLEKDKRNLCTVYDILMQNNDDLGDLFVKISESTSEHLATSRRIANQILSTDPRELSGCMNTARESLRFLESPAYRNMVKTTSLSLEDLYHNKADLFFCIPVTEIKSHGHYFIRFMIGYIFSFLKKQDRPPQKNILFIIDEMAAIGRINEIDEILLTGRSYGISFYGIAQTIDSLKKIYRDEVNSMLSSSLLLFLGVRTNDDQRYVSDRLGDKTVFTQSDSSSKKGTHENQTVSSIKRPLLTTSDIRSLFNDYLIAFFEDCDPIILRKLKYYEDKNYKVVHR